MEVQEKAMRLISEIDEEIDSANLLISQADESVADIRTQLSNL